MRRRRCGCWAGCGTLGCRRRRPARLRSSWGGMCRGACWGGRWGGGGGGGAVRGGAVGGLGGGGGGGVGVCWGGGPAGRGGVGELLGTAPILPACGIALVNPRVPVPTREVFRARDSGFSEPAVL